MGGRPVGVRFAIIAVLVAGALAAWHPSRTSLLGNVPPGLDISGGVELVYRIRTEELPDDQRGLVLAQASQVIQKRLGVLSESKVAPLGTDRIQVQMPGADAQAVEALKEKIRRSGRLEFRMVIDDRSDRPELYRRALRARERDPGDPGPPGTHWYPILGENRNTEVLVDDRVDMTGEGIDPARISVTQDNQMKDAISVSFTPVGSVAMNRIAKRAYKGEDSPQNQRMAILLNDVRALPTEEELLRDAHASGRILEMGTCYSAPAINAPSFDGGCLITGSFTPSEIIDLVGVFQAGSLPAPVELERQLQVGPSLGEDQMLKGLQACLWGTVLVMAFMTAFYLAPGWVASCALVLNLVLLMGIMGGFGATLTLPGMAGIVLTLGMAVDANVLVFERIREELAAGKGVAQAVAAGYERAFVTILDSNLTTILTSAVLYAYGSAQVKGFAVTLALGIAASMFTALVVTHAVFDLAMERGWMTRFRILGLLPRTAIDFVRPARWCMAASAVLLLGGMAHLGIQGRRMLGVDFTGGRILQIRFAQGRDIREVRARIAKVLRDGGYPEGADAQVTSQRPAGLSGDGEDGPPRDFSVTTRNLDLDADRGRTLVRNVLGTALALPSKDAPDPAPGRVAFDVTFASPQDPALLKAALEKAGLQGAEVAPSGALEEGRARHARISTVRRSLVDDLRMEFGADLVPSAFRISGEAPRHVEIRCAVRDMTAEQVSLRLESPAVNLKGCRVTAGTPDARGVAPLEIWSPMTDAEEVSKRLLRYFGPELCLQDIPYARIRPDGQCEVEIRLARGMKLEEFAKARDEVNKGLSLEPGSEGRATEHEIPGDPSSPMKAVLIHYKSGMTDLMQYLYLLRQPGTKMPLVEPFQDARAVEARVRLSFTVLSDRPGLGPAQRAAQNTGGLVVEGELQKAGGGWRATLEVPEDRLAKAQALLRSGYALDLSDPIPRDSAVGGVVAKQAVRDTGWALVFSWAAIIVYMAFRFEFVSGVAAVVALVHDVLATLAVLSFLHVPIDLTIVAALLTIVGFSVNDTIVIFDRIRENLGGRWDVTAEEFGRVVNLSVNQTLSRTLLTSFTVFISVMSLFAGGEVFRGFAIAMLAGVVSGTYSTVYIAAPLVQFWRRRQAT